MAFWKTSSHPPHRHLPLIWWKALIASTGIRSRLCPVDSEISNAVLGNRPYRAGAMAGLLIVGGSLYGTPVQNNSGGIGARTRFTCWSQSIGANEPANVTLPLCDLIHESSKKPARFLRLSARHRCRAGRRARHDRNIDKNQNP